MLVSLRFKVLLFGSGNEASLGFCTRRAGQMGAGRSAAGGCAEAAGGRLAGDGWQGEGRGL